MDLNDITRRRTLGTLGAAGTVALAGCGGDDTDDNGDDDADTDEADTDEADTDDEGTETEEQLEGSISIGVLQDFSGPLPVYGHQGTSGFYAGLAHTTGTDPLPEGSVDEGDYTVDYEDGEIELLVRDSQSTPGEAQELATDLVQDEGADMLYGTVASGSAIRVINTVVDRSEVPFIAGPAADAGITGDSETCRELVFRANENTAMDARSGGRYIAQHAEQDQIALFGADDAFGRSVVENYRQVLEGEGVDIVMERFVPAGQSEWAGLLDEAEDAGAEGMVAGFTAQTLIPMTGVLLAGDWDLQLFGGFASRFSLTPTGDALVDLLDDQFTEDGIREAGFGPFTTRYHWNQYDNEINDAFVDMHVDTYDVVPDLFTGGAFVAASATVQSFDQEGEIDADAVAEQMRGMTVQETPKGENGYEFQEFNNQARSDMTVADVIPTQPEWEDSWAPAIQPSEPLERVPMEVTTIPQGEMTCDLS